MLRSNRVSETIVAIKEPGRTERLKLMLIGLLPYHPQYLPKGTVYDAELQAPLRFGLWRRSVLNRTEPRRRRRACCELD